MSFHLGIHVIQLQIPMTGIAQYAVQSHRVWITGTVVTSILATMINAKVDNQVHGAHKPLIALSKMIWIYRMLSVAEHNMEIWESVNGEYSVHLFNNPHNLLAFVKQILAMLFCNSLSYRGGKGDFCGNNSDCQGDMKCHGVSQLARCR